MFSVSCFAQDDRKGTIKVKKVEKEKIDTIQIVDEVNSSWNVRAITTADTMPTFLGGDNAMKSFIQKNLKYPETEKKAKIQGTVYVTFLVQADGSIAFVGISEGVNGADGFNKEAMRIVWLMPKWIPGKSNGKPVPVKCTLPIKFQL